MYAHCPPVLIMSNMCAHMYASCFTTYPLAIGSLPSLTPTNKPPFPSLAPSFRKRDSRDRFDQNPIGSVDTC